MLSIGILTYNSPITLYNTLLSYKIAGILDYTDDIIVVIQPSSKNLEEKQICIDFSINKVFVNEVNTKMAGAIDLIQTNSKYDYVLFLECDFRATITKDKMYSLLNYSIQLLKAGMDIIRLRSLKNPGHPIQHNLYKRGFNIDNIMSNSRETLSQMNLVTHYLENPEIALPNHITKINNNPLIYLMTSINACYTNNPHIVSKQFYKQYIQPHIHYGGILEDEIGYHWTNYEHKIGVTEGCFTHMRMDSHNGCGCCRIENGGISNNCTYLCCKNEIIKAKRFEETDLI